LQSSSASELSAIDLEIVCTQKANQLNGDFFAETTSDRMSDETIRERRKIGSRGFGNKRCVEKLLREKSKFAVRRADLRPCFEIRFTGLSASRIFCVPMAKSVSRNRSSDSSQPKSFAILRKALATSSGVGLTMLGIFGIPRRFCKLVALHHEQPPLPAAARSVEEIGRLLCGAITTASSSVTSPLIAYVLH
jgi:hypothetical protein